MTAISNVFCRELIACSSDSFLTKMVDGQIEHVETKKSKIFALQGLPGAVSYWGLAKLGDLDVTEELDKLAGQAHTYGTLEKFARAARDHFDTLFDRKSTVPKDQLGLGLHVVGYEEIDGLQIPEIFLVTNFTDLKYTVGDKLGCSRRTNLTITKDSGDDEYLAKHAEPSYRRQVYEYLQSGEVIYFNNGDPELFTIAADAILNSMRALKKRGGLNRGDDVWRDLAIRPIEIIAKLQTSFAKESHRVVGGRVHDLVVYPNSEMFSDSGVVKKRWSGR